MKVNNSMFSSRRDRGPRQKHRELQILVVTAFLPILEITRNAKDLVEITVRR